MYSFMSIFQILLIIQYASIILTIFLSAYIIKKWSKPAHGWLFFYCITTLVNNAGYLAVMNAQTEREALLIWQFTYICRAWIPFTLLKFVLLLCTGKRYSKITTILSHFHILIYLLVLTMKFNPLYYTSYTFVQEGLFPHLVLKNGIMHYVYDALCLIYVYVAMKLLFRSITGEKSIYKKKQLIIITLAILTVVFFYLCKLINILPGYDMSVIGFTLAAVFFYIAIFGFDILDTKNLVEAVVVYDADRQNQGENADGTEKIPPAPANSRDIEAFGDCDSRIKIPVSRILYFEADAEQVFAYTALEIYKVKLRLYQIEDMSLSPDIMRVSKSHIINIKHILSVRPALNSRLYVKMQNGEEVLVSRKYAQTLKKVLA